MLAIESEVFGSCVEDICISLELMNGDFMLCCRWTYARFIWVVRVAQNRRWTWAMEQGNGWLFGGEEVIKEIKSPCGGRGFNRA
jgi:hypothetical protein